MLANTNGAVTAGADFVAGFMYGMTGDNHLTEIEACYQGGDLMVQEVEAGIADIKKGGWDNDTQAALQFGLAALQIPQSLSTCENMDQDIQAIDQWAQIFKNPTALAATLSKHWLFHKTEIKSDIGALEADWDNKLFFNAGVDLADTLTLAVGPIESNLALPPLNMVPDFTAGLIYGFTGDNHLDELRGCMQDVDPLVTDAQTAIGDLFHGHVIKGIEDLGDILWLLPDAVAGCNDLGDDMDAIMKWAGAFKHPVHLGKVVSKNWLLHGVQAKKDLTKEKADWAAGDYFTAGEDVADIMTLLVGPVPEENHMKRIPLFGVPL